MPRLFTALDLPDDALGTLHVFQENADLPARTRWTPIDNHHITLRFIGEVDADRAEAVASVLDTVRHPAFTLRPLGLGVLPSRRTPRVLTVRIDCTPPLQSLYAQVQDALATVDVARETRTFHPHVTLARLKDVRPEPLYETLRSISGPTLDPFPADRFFLYESTLTSDGAVHTVRAAYSLDR